MMFCLEKFVWDQDKSGHYMSGKSKFLYNFIKTHETYPIFMNLEQPHLELSPTKTNTLFSMFSTTTPSTKRQSNQTTPNSHPTFLDLSPQKSTNPFKLLSHNSSLESDSQICQSSGGDRYIPKRKLLKKESLVSEEEQDVDIQNKGTSSEEKGVTISDLYFKVIMTDSPKKRKQTHIESFENNNILKFSQRPVLATETQPLVKESGLKWTDSVQKDGPIKRKINKLPIKVLDAPSLQDDFYLNLLDWGNQNSLAVGLSSSVYLWNASNSKVSKLCQLNNSLVTGVAWSRKDPFLSIGSESGEVQVWDIQKMKKIRSLIGHSSRVGALTWSNSLLSTGSRDKTILNRDIRDHSQFITRYEGHKQEVCGLKWSPDDQQLCSGGNDNRLLVWSPKTTEPVLKFFDHDAAVKAVAWSPHQHGLLVSGGGTADRTIRFRNTLTGVTTKTVEVGSQVCSLMFSRHTQELISTHGYQNHEINLWKMPSMSKVATLTGHSSRVLYLAMSADGSTVVTGAGDETLRFWNLFPKQMQNPRKGGSFLQSQNICIR